MAFFEEQVVEMFEDLEGLTPSHTFSHLLTPSHTFSGGGDARGAREGQRRRRQRRRSRAAAAQVPARAAAHRLHWPRDVQPAGRDTWM